MYIAQKTRGLRARPREEDDAEEETEHEPANEEQAIKHGRHKSPLVLTFVQLLQFRSVDPVVQSVKFIVRFLADWTSLEGDFRPYFANIAVIIASICT